MWPWWGWVKVLRGWSPSGYLCGPQGSVHMSSERERREFGGAGEQGGWDGVMWPQACEWGDRPAPTLIQCWWPARRAPCSKPRSLQPWEAGVFCGEHTLQGNWAQTPALEPHDCWHGGVLWVAALWGSPHCLAPASGLGVCPRPHSLGSTSASLLCAPQRGCSVRGLWVVLSHETEVNKRNWKSGIRRETCWSPWITCFKPGSPLQAEMVPGPRKAGVHPVHLWTHALAC